MTLNRKEYMKEYTRKWAVANREHLREYNKRWRAENKEKLEISLKAYRRLPRVMARKNELNKQWDAAHPEARARMNADYKRRTLDTARRQSRDGKYGMGAHEHFLRQICEQDGFCAICGDILPVGKGTHLDHNHATQQWRGVLCYRCNSGLGNFRDTQLLLSKAAAYLTKWATSGYGINKISECIKK